MENVMSWVGNVTYASDVDPTMVQEAERLGLQTRFLLAMSPVHHAMDYNASESDLSSQSGASEVLSSDIVYVLGGHDGVLELFGLSSTGPDHRIRATINDSIGSNTTGSSRRRGSIPGTCPGVITLMQRASILLGAGCPELTSDSSVTSSDSESSNIGPLVEDPSGSETASECQETEEHKSFLRKRAAMDKDEWFGTRRAAMDEGEWFAGEPITMASAGKKVHFGLLPSARFSGLGREWFTAKRAAMAKNEQFASKRVAIGVASKKVSFGPLPFARHPNSNREWFAAKRTAMAKSEQLTSKHAMSDAVPNGVHFGPLPSTRLPDSYREWFTIKRAAMSKSEQFASKHTATSTAFKEVRFVVLPATRFLESGREWFAKKRIAMSKSEQFVRKHAATDMALTKIQSEPLPPSRPSSSSPGRGASTSSPDSEQTSPNEPFRSAADQHRASPRQLFDFETLETPSEAVGLFHAAAARLRAYGEI